MGRLGSVECPECVSGGFFGVSSDRHLAKFELLPLSQKRVFGRGYDLMEVSENEFLLFDVLFDTTLNLSLLCGKGRGCIWQNPGRFMFVRDKATVEGHLREFKKRK